ncbi:MAG: glycosyl transferase family 2 [Verrucomicrobiales bacterium]|nr:glycosyl transferase family 2 [Verrucomicrobiales bacterium]
MPSLSLVIPLYNEEGNVAALLQEITAALPGEDLEILLVDDCSTDQTVANIPRQPGVRVLEFTENRGQSSAMHAGIMAATAPVIALLDGDLQNDPRDIPAMLAKLNEGYDLVCGYRAKRRDTTFKRLQSRIANFVRSRFTGDGVRDTGCTLKVLRTPCRDCLILFRGMHRFIPALIKGGGFKLTEMPVNHRARVSGVSKYGFGNRALRATTDMFGVKWLLSRQCRYQVKSNIP